MMRLLESLLIAGAFGAMIFFAIALYVIWPIIVFVVGLVISLVKIAFVCVPLFFIVRSIYYKIKSKQQVVELNQTYELHLSYYYPKYTERQSLTFMMVAVFLYC